MDSLRLSDIAKHPLTGSHATQDRTEKKFRNQVNCFSSVCVDFNFAMGKIGRER